MNAIVISLELRLKFTYYFFFLWIHFDCYRHIIYYSEL